MQEAGQKQGVSSIRLDDKWTIDRGRILLNGAQAIARVLLSQKEFDRRKGIDTAGYITGYRGSPLGNVDITLWSIANRLKEAGIIFQPGVNEDIAATAVRGTQQLDAVPGAKYAGVFAAWYGKGPGVDRSGDALKHGNFAGAHPRGGVVVFYGDDHGGKSSSVAHHSEQAMAAAFIPSLYPSNVAEIIEYGLMAYAMSRYSGSWVGMKCVNEVAEQTATADVDLDAFAVATPPYVGLPPEGVHNRVGSFAPLREEQIVADHRLPLVQAFVRANRIDREIFRAPQGKLGIVCAGKSYNDVRAALGLLGLTDTRAATLGVSLYKVGCIWPLEPQGMKAFGAGHDTLFVVEEKTSFVEAQAAAVLVNQADRPLLIGKADQDGAPLLHVSLPLDPITIAVAIAGQLERLGAVDPELRAVSQALWARSDVGVRDGAAVPKRSPYFCSGCPHNRSTRLPEGSLSMTGIGCHTMVNFVRPQEALLPTHMGGEGGNWIGLAPFTNTKHMFQNLGDGTYYHSGLLAIRAAVAAGVNITYKILYNDAVAMTGGQPIDGPISVAEIAQQVRHEGVKEIVIVSDNPAAHRTNGNFPVGAKIYHRDELDAVQRALREELGCSVLIYEQTCAAEKRRRRKRGLYPDPSKRLFIAESVCEGCGDCSVQSTCVSLLPVETEFGRKRAIDQSNCNKDYSCLNGFCPSFITVRGAEPRKPEAISIDAALLDDLPQPRRAAISQESYNLMVAGIGGVGVITVAAILGMAAHIDGLAVSLFDMTGLAQKNGAVYSHVRIAHSPEALHAQRIGRGETDVLLAFDLVAALGEEAASTLAPDRTQALVNDHVSPTVAFQFDRDATIDLKLLRSRLAGLVGEGATRTLDATTLTTKLLGDQVAVNLFLVGAAAQYGLLPMSIAAIERAVSLNGVAVKINLMALRMGRLYAAAPERVVALLPKAPAPKERTLDEVVARRAVHLAAYQNEAYAARYREIIERVRTAEAAVTPGSEELTITVAINYAKLLAYKDEYEVARLLSAPELRAELARTFSGGALLSLNLAPPFLPGQPVNGRPRKREFSGSVMLPILGMLARLRFLRGTAFDPFSYTGERRMERALIAHYETLIDTVLSGLSEANLESATRVLAMADVIRGFGPVKEAAASTYRERVAKAAGEFGKS